MITMSKRVLFAGIAHETHTFVRGLSRLNDFLVTRGEEIWRAEGDTSTVAGGLAIAKVCGWDVIPIIEIIGMAGPLVHDEVVVTRPSLSLSNAAKITKAGKFIFVHIATVICIAIPHRR